MSLRRSDLSVVTLPLPSYLITAYTIMYGKVAPISGNRMPLTAEHHASELSLWATSARDSFDARHMRYHAKALAVIYLVKLFNIGDDRIYKTMVEDFGDKVRDPDVRGWIMGYLAYERNLVLSCGRYELSECC